MRFDRLLTALAAVGAVALVVVASAAAHAAVTPEVSVAKHLQLYSLAVPTEKAGATTKKIVLTVPAGFAIDSFVASPGWTRQVQSAGSGEGAVVQKVAWTGGSTPTGEDSLFQFLAEASSAKTYVFRVDQTYSDGSIVTWSGPESSDTPAPAIEARSSLGGGGGSPTLGVVAVVLGALALVLAGGSLLSRGGKRQLA